MKKIVILLSTLFLTAGIVNCDQTSWCETKDIAQQINNAPRGDKNAKQLYTDHCRISDKSNDRCEIQWVGDFDRYQENLCTQATLKE